MSATKSSQLRTCHWSCMSGRTQACANHHHAASVSTLFLVAADSCSSVGVSCVERGLGFQIRRSPLLDIFLRGRMHYVVPRLGNLDIRACGHVVKAIDKA